MPSCAPRRSCRRTQPRISPNDTWGDRGARVGECWVGKGGLCPAGLRRERPRSRRTQTSSCQALLPTRPLSPLPRAALPAPSGRAQGTRRTTCTMRDGPAWMMRPSSRRVRYAWPQKLTACVCERRAGVGQVVVQYGVGGEHARLAAPVSRCLQAATRNEGRSPTARLAFSGTSEGPARPQPPRAPARSRPLSWRSARPGSGRRC